MRGACTQVRRRQWAQIQAGSAPVERDEGAGGGRALSPLSASTSSMLPASPNQPSLSASRWRALQPGHWTITMPWS